MVAVWLAQKNTAEKPKLFAVRLAREDLVEELWTLIGLNWLAMIIKRKLNKMKTNYLTNDSLIFKSL